MPKSDWPENYRLAMQYLDTLGVPRDRADCCFSSDCGCAACIALTVFALACKRGDLGAAEDALGELRAEADTAERDARRRRNLVEDVRKRLAEKGTD